MVENNLTHISRRGFLKAAAAGAAIAAVPGWYSKEAEASEHMAMAARKKTFGPNDQINVGCIGPGGSKGGHRMGFNVTNHLASKPGVKVVAMCDVDDVHLNDAANHFGPDCRRYKDFRELLAQDDIDAVVIGTPDHWHAYICIAAMEAGKDIYCEKPLTLTIDEGKKLVKTWKETKAVFQTGSQQRSERNFRVACELVRNGRLGKINRVEVRLPGGPVGGPFPVMPEPKDLDWDMWLGPAPFNPYVKQRTHGDFRWWRDYSGGMLTDWGAHHLDIMQWGLGADRSGPLSVEGFGRAGMVGQNCYDTYPEFNLTFTYPDDVVVNCISGGENGIRFEGENGWIFVSRGRLEASDQALLDEPLPEDRIRLYESNDHGGNFIDCVREGRQPICDAEIGHRSVSVCHLSNICLDMGGRKLDWDPRREEFIRNPEANARLARPTRREFKV